MVFGAAPPSFWIHFHLFLLPEMVSSVVSQLSWPDKCAACIKRAPPQKKRDTFVTFICGKVSDWRSTIVKTYSQLGDVRENVRVADDSLRSWKTMRLRQPPKWHIGFQVPAILARWCRSSNCTWSVESEFTTPMSMESKVTLSFNLRFNISLHSILHSP